MHTFIFIVVIHHWLPVRQQIKYTVQTVRHDALRFLMVSHRHTWLTL